MVMRNRTYREHEREREMEHRLRGYPRDAVMYWVDRIKSLPQYQGAPMYVVLEEVHRELRDMNRYVSPPCVEPPPKVTGEWKGNNNKLLLLLL